MSAAPRPVWPKRPDGTPMRLNEMTVAQRREQVYAACRELEAFFSRPRVQRSISAVLSSEAPSQPSGKVQP